jgi:hypothetical protein
VLAVGHDHRAVRELHLVAGSPRHGPGRRDDAGRAAVRAQQEVADPDVAHRRPPGRRRQRRVQGQRLTDGRPRGEDHELAGVQPVRQGVEVLEAGGNAVQVAVAGPDRLDLVQGGLEQIL